MEYYFFAVEMKHHVDAKTNVFLLLSALVPVSQSWRISSDLGGGSSV